jgi:epoxyqueuosine reductase
VSLFEILLSKSLAHEFPLVGALDIESVISSDGAFQEHIKKYDFWLSQGFDGEMGYLKRGRDRRADPRLVFPGAKSILCVAVPYERKCSAESASGPRYARYLRGRDYHEVLAERLERLMQDIAQTRPTLKWKVCVDTSAILERSWAALAGLGWIGKNTTLINPKLGSYLFLGEVLINESVNRGPAPLPNYCGNCTRCLEGCPTSAFSEPGALDSRRCISYWTLEKRGALELSPEDRKAMGTWVAGCDICQEVCPFNKKPSREEVSGIDPLTPYATQSDATRLSEWRDLINETSTAYSSRVKESSLNRVKPAQFSRNLAVAFGNAASSMSSKELRALLPLIKNRYERESNDPILLAEWGSTLEKIKNIVHLE